MKKLFLIIVAVLFLFTGCSTITWGDFSYTRWGDQKIQGLEVVKDGNKITVNLEGQQSDAEALAEAIRIIGVLSVPHK